MIDDDEVHSEGLKEVGADANSERYDEKSVIKIFSVQREMLP